MNEIESFIKSLLKKAAQPICSVKDFIKYLKDKLNCTADSSRGRLSYSRKTTSSGENKKDTQASVTGEDIQQSHVINIKSQDKLNCTADSSRGQLSYPRKTTSPWENKKNTQASVTSEDIQQSHVINIKSQKEWQNYLDKLGKFEEINDFVKKHPEGKFSWCARFLSMAKEELNNCRSPQDFDEGGEKMADFVVKNTTRWLKGIEHCERSLTNSDQMVKIASGKLKEIIEKYLQQADIIAMDFKSGTSSEAWFELELAESPLVKKTDDPQKADTIYEVHRQPRIFTYVDENGNIAKRIFGGACTIWTAVPRR